MPEQLPMLLERAGIALVIKTLRPNCRVIGKPSDRCPAMLRSLEAGKPVRVAEQASLADSLRGGIGMNNRVTFPLIQRLVDEVCLVSDLEIAEALKFAFLEERLILEGAGGAALAAMLKCRTANGPSAILLTGDAIDMASFADTVRLGAPDLNKPNRPLVG